MALFCSWEKEQKNKQESEAKTEQLQKEEA